MEEHYCNTPHTFSPSKFLQFGNGKGQQVLILGEAPAPNGWRKSGKAFYTPEGKFLPTGRNMNKLLEPYNLSVENCNFTELVKCFVGANRKLLDSCGEKCWPILINQLQLIQPSLIILLGVKTLHIFNRQLHKHLLIGELVETHINGKTYRVLPIYHPSPIAPFNHKKNLEIFANLKQDLL